MLPYRGARYVSTTDSSHSGRAGMIWIKVNFQQCHVCVYMCVCIYIEFSDMIVSESCLLLFYLVSFTILYFSSAENNQNKLDLIAVPHS